MEAKDRLREVLLLADAFQQRARDFHNDSQYWPPRTPEVPSDLLAQMRMAVGHKVFDGDRGGSGRYWRRALIRTQIEPVYRAIVAARVQQKAPSPATYSLVTLWFCALWPMTIETPVSHGGWPDGVTEPLFGRKRIARPRHIPRPNKKGAA